MAINKVQLLISLVIFLLNCTAVPVKAEISAADQQYSTTDGSNLPARGKKLRVGIAGDPPAVIKSELGQMRGIAVDYWQDLAEDLPVDYELVTYSTVKESLAALADGQLDLALGNISITAERIAQFDFTQSVMRENLTLLLPSSPPTLWSTLRPFVGWAFLSSIGGIWLCLFIVGNLLWLAERHQNNKQFPHSYRQGIIEGMWCALATFTTVGYGDRSPVTHLGRFVAGVWMILSLVMVTSLTAGIATTLAVAFSAQPSEQYNHPEDLKGARIATVGKGSSSTRWTQFYGARVSETETLSEAIDLLTSGGVDGVVSSRHGLEYYLHQHPQVPYRLANFNFGAQSYGIALPLNSPLTRQLNELILNIQVQINLQKLQDDWRVLIDENQ